MDGMNNKAAQELKDFLVEELSDTQKGPLSDMGYLRSEVVEGGDRIELFVTEDESAWPVASFDVRQLAYALTYRGYRKESA